MIATKANDSHLNRINGPERSIRLKAQNETYVWYLYQFEGVLGVFGSGATNLIQVVWS